MKKFVALFIALLLVVPEMAQAEKVAQIVGAGATFPMPFYAKIFKSYYKSTSVLPTYGGIGSGGGIRSLKDKVVDFGATDAFLNDKKMKDMPAEIVHMPTCLGAVCVAYNLPGNPSIKLDSKLMEKIFMGEITKWNDSDIKALNKGVNLPDQAITVVHRSDGSGTTFAFSDYMSAVSSKWADKVGKGKSLKWPVGIGAKGNPGVAGTISQTIGAIGYVASEYAMAQNIPVAAIKNKSGNFIKPSIESVSLAANQKLPADTRTSIVNTSDPNGYPIATFTWLIIYKEQNYDGRSKDRAKATLDLLMYVIGEDAQKAAPSLHYAPLPKAAVKLAKDVLESVTYNGKEIL